MDCNYITCHKYVKYIKKRQSYAIYYGINNLVQICKENGEWGGTVRCDVRCKDGECVDTECEPGDERSGVDYVTGLPYSWICDEQGKWVSNN